jgi:hypothetical protein
MLAMMPPAATGALAAALVGAAAYAAVRAAGPERIAAAPSASTPGVFAGLGQRRVVAALLAGFVVLFTFRWLLLAAVAAVLVLLWGRLVNDTRADDERRRVEAVAVWLEHLRDTLRGSSMAAEHALEHVARRPPDALAEPMGMFLQRRRQGLRTDEALTMLADDLAHPTADAAIAALLLVVSGSAGAGRLHRTVDSLAVAARDEVSARERVDRTRAVYRSSMKRLIVIGGLLVAYLRFAAGDLLRPYDSPVGQVMLLLPLGMWAGCVLWLRSMCRYDLPERGSVSMEAS